jgi:aminoglycoside 6'-N-acetyltransferase I
MIEVRILGADDAHLLGNVADDVFDEAVDPTWCAEFLADPRHHLAVAIDGNLVVGMASGVHHLHPDKPHQLFINEAGVAEPYRCRGIGRQLLRVLLAHATTLGCESAWVLTESDNAAARKMYAAAGGTEQAEAPVMIEFRT